MKKEKIVMTITIGIACFALTLVMFMQFKVVNQTDITAIENMRESDLRIELASWKEKYQELSEKYEETNLKLQEYKKEQKSDTETAKLLEEELAELELFLGKTDVKGEGIMIYLEESEGSEDPIGVSHILEIINSLKVAGAEAISVNGERIVAMSDVAYIMDEYLRVNGQRIESPYIIKAIGNQSYLKSSIMGSGGIGDSLKMLGHKIKIEESQIEIAKYNKTYYSKYMQ